jgi:hypothetical protein
LFTLVRVLKIGEVAKTFLRLLCSTVKMRQCRRKNVLGHTLGAFFTNSSGHPARESH